MRPDKLTALVTEIKETTDILEIIGERVPLNSRHMSRCPFHDDQNPSFSVNPAGQYFHCFGCGVGGDVIKFLMLYERKGFVDVLLDLAARARIQIPKSFGRR